MSEKSQGRLIIAFATVAGLINLFAVIASLVKHHWADTFSSAVMVFVFIYAIRFVHFTLKCMDSMPEMPDVLSDKHKDREWLAKNGTVFSYGPIGNGEGWRWRKVGGENVPCGSPVEQYKLGPFIEF